MSGNSLLGCVANRVAPYLLVEQRDDPDAFLRHLQLASAQFISRFSGSDNILTRYTLPKEQRQTEAAAIPKEKNSEVIVSVEEKEIYETYPLQTALCFAPGENESSNQMHLFELNIFRALLRRPRQDYAHTMFWSALIEKLEEIDFYKLMQTNIARLWAAIAEQLHEPEALNWLRVLQLSCDVLLLFSEHAARLVPSSGVLHELTTLAQTMWIDDAPLILRRCAVLISALLVKFSSSLPLEVLRAQGARSRDAPHQLAVLANVPALCEKSKNSAEGLRMALEIVFTTSVYSIPIAAYFRTDGDISSTLPFVQQCVASILHRLIAAVSSEFWGYFSQESLLSLVEASATYACLWDSLPAGMHTLQRHIHSLLAEKSNAYTSSLLMYCTTACAYHCRLSELEDENPLHGADAPRPIVDASLGVESGVEDNGAVHNHATGNLTVTAEGSPVKRVFRLLTAGWSSFRGDDRVLVRSALALLHALLCNYPHELKDLERLIGRDVQSLFRHFVTTLLKERAEDASLVEVVYRMIAQFHGMLGNVAYVASNILLPDVMKGVGLRHETTGVAQLQLHLYNALLQAYEGVLPPSRIVEAIMHIQPGAISRLSLSMPFFVQWLSIVQATLLDEACPLSSLLSFGGSLGRLIHCLCEGAYVLMRELQAGNVILCGAPVVPLLEVVIRILSAAVLDEGCQDVLATCVITVHGESTLSACFMLYCLLFSANAKAPLVESTAGLLTYVVENSKEKLFTTMRFHTSTEMKRNLLLAVYRRMQPPTRCVPATNVIRLASLRYLLRCDPASFFFLVVPEELEKVQSGLPLTRILRDTVKCHEATALEKAEALALLRALDDVAFSIPEVTSLLSNTECGSAYTRAAFTAAVTNYVCGALLGELRTGCSASAKSPERGPHRSPSRPPTHPAKGKVIAAHPEEIHVMIDEGCKALSQCVKSCQSIKKELRYSVSGEESLYTTQSQSKDTRQLIVSRAPKSALSTVVTTRRYGALAVSDFAWQEKTKIKPLLLGDGFLLEEGEGDVYLNQMASVLESTMQLTLSLETLVWLTYGERDAYPVSVKLLEMALGGTQMVEPTAAPLRSLMWSCLDGWLALARAATAVITQASSDTIISLSTSKLNPLFHRFVKLMLCHRGSIEVVCQGLGILRMFQPFDAADEAALIEIFELIADVMEKHASMGPSNVLFDFITESSAIYNRLGSCCPLRCAIRTLESLWAYATHVSHLIPATEPGSSLCDIFDHVVDAVNNVLLHCGGVSIYFSHKHVMALANALGQFTGAASYNSVANVYEPQAWHRAWLSVLGLLHTVLASCDTVGPNQTEWLTAISTLATTSPRFRDAVSGFMLFSTTQEPKPFSWELREMQVCMSIIALLASLGVSVAAITPLVRRCFCRIRRFQIQTMLAPEGGMDERSIELLLVTTVRHQLSYLIQQPPPPVFLEDDSVIVTIERFHTSVGSASISTNGLLQQRRGVGDETSQQEEQLSFDSLRSFILRELNIIRKSHRDSSCGASTTFSPEHTPSLHSSFGATSAESLAEVDLREGGCQYIGPHIDNVQLALGLFVRYARFHLNMRSLNLWERQELSVTLEKLLHALNRLIHDVRRLENTRLTWVLETVQEDLQGLAGNLQGC
ncbi:hypothetical protein DQ04_04751010 [Trypanosoma grayi]|uniref:hypothetical protein n=1 Tax=Trypanosoma grayi TaxID=71804 RepID=UPI0004F4B227|nr:hypothetical protein DQ04_04751010 [Trypanosoma grayi]KEG09726.1 hypothetical protein DQ04_04751010 [Trypanosoma grayi]